MTFLLAISLVAGIKAGNAARYGYADDPYDRGGALACEHALKGRHGKTRWEHMREHGVAHRSLPCGARIGLCLPRTRRCMVAYVVDRGPYGALSQRGRWHLRTGLLRAGERYRGELDLLPGVYSAIRLVGVEQVLYWPATAGAR